MNFLNLLLLSGFLFLAGMPVTGKAQDAAGEELPPDTAGIVIFADSRLDILTKREKNAGSGIRSVKGYRLQIYNGNDKRKAIQTKVDFMRRFPDVPTYMTYVQPQFRVKAGDFRTRRDAQELYRQVSHLYETVMIVPDIIVINPVKYD